MGYVVIRLSGQADLRHDQKKTLESLRLHYVNHATIVPETPSYEGMLKRVEHHVTYGEIDEDTAVDLLEARGRAEGDAELTDELVAENTEYGSISELATALVDDEIDIGRLGAIKPVFRLAPARGGFEGQKRHFNEGGALGYRGDAINDLVDRML